MADAKYVPRLKTEYDEKIVKTLMKDLNIKNINQVPKLEKVVVSCGVGKKREDKRYTETVALTLAKITGRSKTGSNKSEKINRYIQNQERYGRANRLPHYSSRCKNVRIC